MLSDGNERTFASSFYKKRISQMSKDEKNKKLTMPLAAT
jgi:hypothetical protein